MVAYRGGFARAVIVAALAWASLAVCAANPPEADRGLSWLAQQVRADGSLAGESQSIATVFQARIETHAALKQLATAPAALTDLVASEPREATEYLARKVAALAAVGRDFSTPLARLGTLQNPDGGFGGAAGYQSNPLDTAFALLALRATGAVGSPSASSAVSWLVAAQATDGSFAVNEQPSVYVTAIALQSLNAVAQNYPVSAPVQAARARLVAMQVSGAHGNVLDNATAALALAGATTDTSAFSGLQAALKSAQAADGGWSGDPYLTAIAVRALVATGTPPAPPTTGQVSGIVVDDSTGAPLAGVAVQATGPSTGTATSGASGSFLVGGLNPGSYAVQFSRSGYAQVTRASSVVAGVASDLGTVRLPLDAGTAALQGVVRDGANGQPLAGVTVALGAASAVTDAAGSYRLAGIASGDAPVTVSKTGYQLMSVPASFVAGATLFFSPSIYPVGVAPGATTANASVASSATQLPIAGATVSAGANVATTDAVGKATLSGLAAGMVTIQASATGFLPVSTTMLIAPGANEAPRFLLAPAATSITLSGKVTDAVSLAGIGGATVRVQNTPLAASTGAAGQYQLPGITATQFIVMISAPGYASRTVIVSLSQLADARLDAALDRSSAAGLTVLSTRSELPVYQPFGEIGVLMDIRNATAAPQTLGFSAILFDASRTPVLYTNAQPFTLAANGTTTVDLDLHNTTQPPGTYSVVVQGVDGNGVVAVEGSASFTIDGLARIAASLSLTPPVALAGTSQPIAIDASISNHGNVAIPAGPVELTITLDTPDLDFAPLGQTTSGPPVLSGAPLNRPVGAVYDAQGVLWLLNGQDGKIIKVSPQPDGKFVTETWLDPATLPLPNPFTKLVGLTIDGSGNLYVLNESTGILRIDPSKAITKITVSVPSNTPRAISWGGGTVLYLAVDATAGSSVVSLDFGASTTNPTVTTIMGAGFTQPNSVAALPGGTAFVSNAGNNSIMKISPQGVVSSFITAGLNGPRGLAISAAGELLIAESGANRILRVPTTGSPTAPFGVYSDGANLSSPGAIAMSPDGKLYVANTAVNSIAVVPPGGGTAQPFVKSLVEFPQGMTYDGAGNLYVAGSSPPEFVKVDPAGNVSSLAPTPGARSVIVGPAGNILVSSNTNGRIAAYPPVGPEITGLSGPEGIAVRDASSIYVAEKGANRISIVDITNGARSTLVDSYVNSGDDLWFAPNGDRYVLNGTRIDRVTATSGTRFTKSGVAFFAQAFVARSDGGFYVIESNAVKSVSPAGDVSALPNAPTLPTLGIGAVLAANGNILLADRNGRKIISVNPATGAVTPFADLSSFSVSQLWAISGDGAGGVFAAITDGKILRVPAAGGSGSLVTAFSFGNAWRLDFDAVANVLYAKTSNDVRFFNVNTPSQVTSVAIPAGNAGTLKFANGLIHVVSGTAEIRSYSPQGALAATLAGFEQPTSLVFDGTRIIVADNTKTISIVPGQLPQTLADETVGFLALQGGTIYGTRALAILSLPAGSRAYVPYFTMNGLSTLSGIASRPGGGFTFASQGDQRVLTIDAAKQVIASYAGVRSTSGLAVDGAGNLFVASLGLRQITKIDPVTRQSVVFDTFIDSNGLAFLNGQLVANDSKVKFYKYAADGTRTQAYIEEKVLWGGMFGAGSAVYAIDTTGLKVTRWDGTTNVAVGSGLTNLNALRFGSDGALYTGGTAGSVTRVANGQIRMLAGDLGNVTAITQGPNGRIYAGSSLGYLTTFDPGTFKRTDLTNVAALNSAIGSPLIPYLATDAGGVIATGAGSTPAEVYRVTYTPAANPAAAGTIVLRQTVAMPALPVGASVSVSTFVPWPVPYPGDFRFAVHRTDAVSGEGVNMLHAGQAAGGVIALSSGTVPPGTSSVRVTTRVTGADFTSLARVDTARTALVNTDRIRPNAMGADSLGRIYLYDGQRVWRTKSTGGVENIWTSFSGNGGRGLVPIDNAGIFYVSAGKDVFGISSTTLQQVTRDTMPETVLSLVRDSQDTIWVLTIRPVPGISGEGQLYRLKPGQAPVLLPTAAFRNPYSLAIDGRDNLYVQTTGQTGARTDAIIRVNRDGTSAVVIAPDASGDPTFEFEGVSMTGDCADNIFVTPLTWKKYGQGAGWNFPQFEEEHYLIQVNGTTGKPNQIFEGTQFSLDLSDMDGVAYDRFGGRLLVMSERWLTTNEPVIYSMPVTCGAISTDLHMVVPAGQATSGYNVTPTSSFTRADGATELVWNVKDVALSGQSLSFETALPGLLLGEKRPVATESFLVFHDAFTDKPIKVPLAVPAVTVDGLVDVGVTASPSSYPANTPIAATVTLASRDVAAAHAANLAIAITDAQGEVLAQLPLRAVTVAAGGTLSVPVAFNTGTYLSGSYLVKATLIDAPSGIATASGSAAFDILADNAAVIASLSADKASYQPVDVVTLDARAKNVSLNSIVSDVTLSLVVRDPSGGAIFSDTRTVSTLVPGSLQDAFFQVRLNTAQSGTYSAQLAVSQAGGASVTPRTTTFTVLSTVDTGSGIQGALAASRFANAGDTVNLAATVLNRGNAAVIGVPITFRVVNPANGAALFTQPGSVTVPVGGEQQVAAQWVTTGIAAGNYVAVASATFSGREIVLGQAPVTLGAIQPFAFAARTLAPLHFDAESDPVIVAGIVAPASISVQVGEFRVNDGPWSGSVGLVSPGDRVTVRVRTADTFGTTTTAVLAIAGFSAPFAVTTRASDTTPDPFAFTSQTGVPLLTQVASNTVVVTGIDAPAAIAIAGGEYSVNGGPFTAVSGSILAGDSLALRVTSSASPGATIVATVTIGGVSATFSVTTTAVVATPAPFAFTAQNNVPRSTQVVSNAVTISGINVAVPVSVTGGEYQVNGGAFTAAAGTVSAGATIALRLTSSPDFSKTTTAVLTVASVSGSFSVTTEGADSTPDAFSFSDQVDVALSTARTSNTIVVRGINTGVPIRVTGGEFRINSGAFTAAPGTVQPLDTVTLRQTSSASFATRTTATLTVSEVSAPFNVTTKAAANITAVAAIGTDARVLVFVACKSEDDGDDDAACVSQRAVFLDGYLASAGVDHKVVTSTIAFKVEMRSGRYNAYWITGGAKKLEDDFAEELREAAFRGETLIVDGVHDERNKVLDEAAGVVYKGKPSHLDTVTLTAPFLPTGSFDVGGNKAIRVSLTTGARQAKFNSGDPAIVTNAFGSGHGLLFAFDLTGTLQAQAASALLRATLLQSLDFVTPTAPLAFSGGAYVPFVVTVKSTETVPVTLDVTLTLPPGFTLVSSAPPATQAASAVVWHVTLAAGASLEIEGALRTPDGSSIYLLPFALSQTSGGASLPLLTASLPVAGKGLETTLPQVIQGLQALSVSAHGDSSDRDHAVESLQAAQVSINAARWEEAIARLVDAIDRLADIGSVNVSGFRVNAGNVMKEVERRWWASLPPCPASGPCRTP